MMVDFRVGQACQQAPTACLPFHEWKFPDGTPWAKFYRTDAGYLLRFDDLADFRVSADGLAVVCTPAIGVADATPEHLYLNQVLPLVQSKLGKLVFHASAVEVGDVAVAFVAESGRGKSTLAASFATNGFRFLTDDGLLLEAVKDGYNVLPSHPLIRLWDDSEAALVVSGTETAPRLHFTPKTRFLAGLALTFCDQPRPLRRVYFLGPGEASTVTFERMSPAAALMAWVNNSFLLDIEEQSMLAAHFDRVARLASEPIYYRLDYPRRFEDLPHVRQAIVEHTLQENR